MTSVSLLAGRTVVLFQPKKMTKNCSLRGKTSTQTKAAVKQKFERKIVIIFLSYSLNIFWVLKMSH